MKHAGPAALDSLAKLLCAIRAFRLTERQRGVFYRKGKAYLHFHEDPAGLFADMRMGAEWKRFPVSRPEERDGLLTAIERDLNGIL